MNSDGTDEKTAYSALHTNIENTVNDYTRRLGAPPCLVIAGQYALWRTDVLNISVRYNSATPPGSLRHLGWEDSTAENFSQETDVNGVVWERFNAMIQAEEIAAIWPEVAYQPDDQPR